MVPTDYDNRRDIDVLLVRPSSPVALYRNMRDGTFQDWAADTGLAVPGENTALAVADVNKDGYLVESELGAIAQVMQRRINDAQAQQSVGQ